MINIELIIMFVSVAYRTVIIISKENDKGQL